MSTFLTPERALKSISDIWDRHYKNVVAHECEWEDKMEPLADLYKERIAIAKAALERASGVQWGGHPAMGDVFVVIRRNFTDEEKSRWGRITDEIDELEDVINARP